jgi:DNA polymerase
MFPAMTRGTTGAGGDARPAEVPVDARSLAALARAARACTACPLYRDATQTVFGAGPPAARLLLVGEQPGDEEDREGAPFVGPAGRLLEEMLAQAGLVRGDVYLTNAVKHFKFVMKGKRRLHQKPRGLEIAACRPWLLAEIDRVRPRVILALGATASAALFGARVSVTRDRRRPVRCELAPHCRVTFHPSAALRAPLPEARRQLREAIIEDLRAAAALVTRSGPPG